MRILFDLTKTQPLNGSKFHGGGNYGKLVFFQLCDIAPNELAVYYNPDLFLDDNVKKLIETYEIPIHYSNKQTVLEAAMQEGHVIYSPLLDNIYIDNDTVDVIATIHGFRALEMPNDSLKENYNNNNNKNIVKSWLKKVFSKTIIRKKIAKEKLRYKSFLENAKFHFVTVSNHSKASILCFYPHLVSDDIKVFYSPDTSLLNYVSCDVDLKEKYGKYYLIVSGGRWLKNSLRAIIAFDNLFSERPDFDGKVIVTGAQSAEVFKYRIHNISRFEFVGYVENDYLTLLYKYSYLFVYPSLNEGFGYPPLEAMKQGCPVIGSAIASIPEVCADSILYFNPFSIDEIKMRIIQMEDLAFRESYIQKGYKQQKMIAEKQNSDLIALCNYILSFNN